MTTPPRFLGIGLALGLAAGLFLGHGLAQPGRAAAVVPSAAPGPASHGAYAGALGAPAVATKGGSSGASGLAVAYPYFGGSPGVAPDHTIVVTGFGQAALKADGSDGAAAQKSALLAALADAKAQGDTIAAATGLSISGVLSVSASVSPSYGVMPMTGSGGEQPPGSTVSPIAPQPAYPQTLSVSVTVAYRVS